MDRSLILPIGLVAAGLLCPVVPVQAQKHFPWPVRHSEHAAQTGQSTPFPLGQEEPPPSHDVEFRTSDQMTASDRALASDSQSAIARRAGLEAIQFNQGDWTQQQIVCRALPNHLFLRFTRIDGARDRSVFTVSIPRNERGRVRLIPVLRGGYSLFSPAGVNAETIAAFNQIRHEDGTEAKAGWLATGLCYAALAGADPRVGPLTGDEVLSASTPPVAEMEVLLNGGAVVRFTDQDSHPHPTLWIMTFDRQGALLKVAHQSAVAAPHVVVPEGQKVQEHPVPADASRPVTPVPPDETGPPPAGHLTSR